MSEEKMTLCVYKRARRSMCEVLEVVSFDEDGAHIICEDGEVFVDGENIRIEGLDKRSGDIEITGRINAIAYSDGKQDKGRKLHRRLFG